MTAYNHYLVLVVALLYCRDVNAVKGSQISHRGQFSFQADLIIAFKGSDTLYQTGSLISKNYVLTTASIVIDSDKITVVLGAYDVENKTEPTRRTYDGSHYSAHSRYDPKTGLNNIAVIKLNQSAEINDFIKTVPLPRFSYICKPLIGKVARVSGWGNVIPPVPIEYSVLRYADVRIKPPHDCLNVFPHTNYKQLCTTDSKKYFEQSDIGAPLVLGKTLVGVAAASAFNNGIESAPQVYTRIDVYLDWIKSSTDVTILYS
ncbi:hypothetical protein FQA39_LY08222 [Lamprigera yunnana]|nr:hypothetical protein FQA39_LY08222 [Lamprigera yunnana]